MATKKKATRKKAAKRKPKAVATLAATAAAVSGLVTFDFGRGPVAAHRHRNPDGSEGGWVSGNTRVYDNARVSGNTRVYDNARVYGNAWVDLIVDFLEARGNALGRL